MNRKIYYWKLRTTELQLGERTLIMGVLNVTPDSFSDGGRFNDPDRAYARAIEMEEEGVDIIDIGGESTRPDSKRISADEEWQRLVPVLKRLRGKLNVPLSLDTYKSETAERALEYGIEILNDPSGLTFDADLAKVAVNGNAGLILNHMRGLPETWAKLPPLADVVGAVSKELEATVSRARRMGVEKNRIVVDPGLGFGKRKEQNSEILAHLARLAGLDCPILVGPSRKSFLTNSAEGETIHATAAAVAAAILNGAHIVRVHDVKEMRAVAQVADEIVRSGAAASKAAAEAAERSVAKPRRTGPAFEPGEQRAKPTRPPLSAKPLPPPPPPAPEPVSPAAREVPAKRPTQDRPSKGWTPVRRADGPPPRGERPSRPAFDKKPFEKKPFEKRTLEKKPFEKRTSDRERPFRPGGERPPQGRPPQGRPSQGGPAQGRPPQGGAPRRPFRKRP